MYKVELRGSSNSQSPAPTLSAFSPTTETILLGISPQYPSSGDSVTLTAPTLVGATYQWQRDYGSGSWSSASALSATTLTVASSLRGTQKYRVVVTQSSGTIIESQPVHVIWDEFDIVDDLIRVLVSSVASTTAYTNAESSLKLCVNSAAGSSHQNLDDILSNYHGTSKTMINSSCGTQLSSMFSVLGSEFRSKLQDLIRNNPEYRQLLDADRYSGFAQGIAEVEILKRNTWKLASEEARIARANSDRGARGDSGSSGSTRSETNPPPSTQLLPCLPDSKPATVQGKMIVLNCLTVNQPYSFWQAQAVNPTLKTAIDSSLYDGWLGREKWDCSAFPDAPLPACLKHDVTWDSLRKFVGGSSNDVMDEAWGPRNKFFADELFYFDIKEHGCQNPSWNAREFICEGGFVDRLLKMKTIILRLNDAALAGAMQFGVRVLNSKFWVYTYYDIEHIDANPSFTAYDIPKVAGVNVTSPSAGIYQVDWTYNPGTVSSATVNEYHLCWGARWYGQDREQCPEVSGDALSYSLTPLSGRDISQTGLRSMTVQPNRAILYFPGRKYDKIPYDPPHLPR